MESYRAYRNEEVEGVTEKTQEEKDQESNERVAKTAIKGGATAVGAFFGGTAGANIGSKVGDAINNSQIGQNLSQAGGQVLNRINKINPMGRQMQQGINKMNESGGFDAIDSGIDAVASQGKGASNLNSSSKSSTISGTSGKKDMFSSLMGGSKGSGSIMDMIPPAIKIKIYVGMFGFLFVILLFVIVFADPNEMNLGLTSDYKASAASPSGGVSESIGDFKLFYQTGDTSPFAGSTIEKIGCGPVVMAMILTNLLDRDVLPSETAKYALDNNHVIYDDGVATSTSVTLLSSIATTYGVQYEGNIAITEDNIRNNLSQGKLMVLLVGPGTFTSQNHFIVLRGLSIDGNKVAVADPLSSEKSNTLYDFNTLITEGIDLYSFWV